MESPREEISKQLDHTEPLSEVEIDELATALPRLSSNSESLHHAPLRVHARPAIPLIEDCAKRPYVAGASNEEEWQDILKAIEKR